MSAPHRLVFVGEAVLDVTTWIAELPARGGDRLATASVMTPGGGFNVMVAAARHGMAVLFTGRHGTGPAGDMVRDALASAGIEVLRAVDRDADTGFVVTMVEPNGERTFVTSPGALSASPGTDLGSLSIPGDFVYVSGYGLVADHGGALAAWVGSLGREVTVVFDPGPLAGELPRDLLDPVLVRADWASCNAREAAALAGVDDPVAAGRRLAGSVGGGQVVVRTGPDGCILVRRDPTGAGAAVKVEDIAAPVVAVVDTTGAGDTHVGVLLAGLAGGLDPLTAAHRATVAATLSVTRRGPATAPSREELDRAMDGR